MPATVWRALHIFTQVILFTTYEVVINYPPLVKYERDIPKKKDVNHPAQGHKASK